MPPKRKAPADAERPPAKKAATKPKLKKSTAPNWTADSTWTQEKPTGEWGKKCVDRWCLLAPYDSQITEAQWKTYYDERSALDRINTSGAEESKSIVSEELDQDTWTILRQAAAGVASAILGSKLEDQERRKRIARTLLGSLYFTDLWGNDEGNGTPREVRAKTRLYSPFGIGTSVDFFYYYHFRMRMHINGERISSLYAKSKIIHECNAEKPSACTATEKKSNGIEKAAPDAITLFDQNGKKSKGTTAVNIKSFEEPLFGCEGWLSPLKLLNLLLAAGTVLHYNEYDTDAPKSLVKKFQFFEGEDNGAALIAQERALLPTLDLNGEVCIPQYLLSLARSMNEGTNGQGGATSEQEAAAN